MLCCKSRTVIFTTIKEYLGKEERKWALMEKGPRLTTEAAGV